MGAFVIGLAAVGAFVMGLAAVGAFVIICTGGFVGGLTGAATGGVITVVVESPVPSFTFSEVVPVFVCLPDLRKLATVYLTLFICLVLS